MKNTNENIKLILAKYLEGNADVNESRIAEEYLLYHPDVMEKFAQEQSLTLFPPKTKEKHNLSAFKTAADYDEGQFMLLAAAAAEGDLTADILSDFKAAMDASPEKTLIAHEFLNLKLKPKAEDWKGKKKALHTSPFVVAVRKTTAVILSAAAIITAVIMLSPALFREFSPDSKSLSMAVREIPKNEAVISVAKEKQIIPQPVTPVQTVNKQVLTVSYKSETTIEPPRTVAEAAYDREVLSAITTSEALLPRITSTNQPYIASIKTNNTNPLYSRPLYDNWMINGLANVALAITDDKKNKDPYVIAGEGIKEINKLLGWKIQFEKVLNTEGEVSALSFQSKLLSFSAPVKNK